MSKLSQSIRAIGRSPFLWGILGSVGFYALVHYGPLGLPLVKRYFAGHPVEYMETIIFGVGLAALTIKLFDTFAQRAALGDSPLGPAAKTSQPAEQCDALLARLDRLPERRRGEYYVSRLRAALEHVRHRGSADSLGDELKYLSDVDAARVHSGHGLFRVIVWAIPILGFLGTVIGITMALNGIDLRAPDESMFDVLNGLGVKFDTTALALSLAMVLMFVHYYVEQMENRLLEEVDRRVQSELAGRFAAVPGGADGQIVAMQRMAEMMLQASETLARRQAELWRDSVESAAGQWSKMAEAAGGRVQAAMSAATGELSRQAEVLRRAVEAAGEVARLEDALNRNLAALAGAKHFQQTVLSLAAAVNMLSARLAESPGTAPPIKLEPPRRATHAA
ncbi:MAG: MotA/TolQ/ExbB proton channel family protein [Planctomycetes bacterium]|nr:MotA/TolQ/ExbB proton channel family protein [Planctomycetota bacterium]MCG2683234.1 MotA/TolQ/ExbB proton channel family protein [Planctomycetales bacterium]